MFGITYFGCFVVATLMGAVKVSADNGQVWMTQDEFINMVPAILLPTFTFPAMTPGECFLYCQLKDCSSVGYSDVYKTCKLYNHPDLMKPLPQLIRDPANMQYRMYYKKKFCPSGWEADSASGKCYFVDTSSAKQRPAAWQVCEEHMMSELVTFQTPLQRDNLYQILTSKYSSVSKLWSGYAQIDSMLWPRPVDEFPGYRARRGDCPNNDIAGSPFTSVMREQCVFKCDRTYRDKCVGFTYDGVNSQCWLKYKLCDVNSNTKTVNTDYWIYDKVHAGRPMTKHDGLNATTGSDITNGGIFLDVSEAQCKAKIRSHLDGVLVSYIPSTRRCVVQRRTTASKTSCTGCVSWDLTDINEGWCPYGVRYRDVCLVVMRTPGYFQQMESWCRTMGGKFTRPVDFKRKTSYLYGLNANFFIDWMDIPQNLTYTTQYDRLSLANAVYDKWNWNIGEPNANEYCGTGSTTRTADATGTYLTMNNVPCTSSYTTIAVCELPITQPFPRTCHFTPDGREYMGQVATTTSGAACKAWSATGNSGDWRNFPDWHTSHSYCRNPVSTKSQPWCYRNSDSVAEICDVPLCPETDWAPSQSFGLPESPYAAITKTGAQTDNYYWTVEAVTATANPLCQINMNDWCPYYFRGSCYQFYQIPYNHNEAKAICAQNGWHLASITSLDEQKFILGITQRMGHQWYPQITGYHIGLYWSVNNWAWENGESYSTVPNLWNGGSPGSTGAGICASIYSSNGGWWTTVQCWLKDWFLCEIELAG